MNYITDIFSLLELFQRLTGGTLLFGRKAGVFKSWLASAPYVFISHPSTVEVSFNISTLRLVLSLAYQICSAYLQWWNLLILSVKEKRKKIKTLWINSYSLRNSKIELISCSLAQNTDVQCTFSYLSFQTKPNDFAFIPFYSVYNFKKRYCLIRL